MKLRLTQLCLKATPKPLSLGPVEIVSTQVNHKKENKFTSWLLPEGFPRSVHASYAPFTTWTSFQGVTSSILGVLSTQAMLGTLMSGEPSESVPFSPSTASATINWILKDGLGQAGGIALVALLGSKLDSHAKMLRFHSSLLFVAGSALEFAVPWFCLHWGAGMFLPVAAIANVVKNSSWMLSSATRAHFMRQMSLKGNLGDLTGKAASQMTLATLIGTTVGLGVLKDDRWSLLATTWLTSAFVSLVAGYRSSRVAFSRQLNPVRLQMIVKNYQKGMAFTPEVINGTESIFLPSKLPKVVYNAPLSSIPVDWADKLLVLKEKRFVSVNSSHIWTTADATSKDKLAALISVSLNETESEKLIQQLEQNGWDVKNFTFAPLEDPNRAIRLLE